MGEDGYGGSEESSSSKSTSIFLQIVEHPDGSITRPTVPLLPTTNEQSNPVHSKDVPLNPTTNTWLRLYLPNPPPTQEKLPIILFFHGGGFVLFSPDFVLYHQFCEQMAAALPALVVSLDYRLAPEHRLPAAYEDAVDALLWVRSSADPWIINHGDLSRSFMMGSSSGGNMAYYAGLRALSLELNPVKLVGLVLNQPYFGGEERTQSEIESAEDVILPLRANEMMWRMALPKGADRDHEFCNPVAAPPPHAILQLPRCLVKGCKGDPLVDRQLEFLKILEGAGVNVVAPIDDEGYHAIELFDPAKTEALCAEIRNFVYGSTEASA